MLLGCTLPTDTPLLAPGTQGNEWEEKWGEKYWSAGRAEKWAEKWGREGSDIWHEKWGESYDGAGACCAALCGAVLMRCPACCRQPALTSAALPAAVPSAASNLCACTVAAFCLLPSAPCMHWGRCLTPRTPHHIPVRWLHQVDGQVG